VKSAEEKAASKVKAEARKTAEKKKRGRPKGSKNKVKQAEVVLNAELLRIQKGLKSLLETIGRVST
jgi:flagellar motor switch protein FliM